MKKIVLISAFLLPYLAFSQCTNCGIGTNVPQSKLEIKGCGNTSATSSFGVKNTSAGSDSVMLFVRDDGNVGIGNFAPAYPLDIQKNGTGAIAGLRLFNKATAANNNGSQLLFGANRTTSGLTDIAGISGIITDITQAAYKGALIFYTSNNAAPAERMRIDNAGNVGIGVTPTSTFHVVSTASTTNGSDIIANSITTGVGMNLSMNALTTGSGIKVSSSATGITSGSLMFLSSTGAIGNASGSVLNITSTGVNTAGNVATIIGNSATTGNILNLSGTALTSGSLISATAGTTTGNAFSLTANTVNTGVGINLTTNGLTTGSAIKVASSATGITTGSLMLLSSTGAIANASGSVFNITSTGINTAGNVATIVGNSATTGNILNLSGTALTSGALISATAGTTTGNAFSLTANTVNTGAGINLTTNGLTTGSAIKVASSATGITTGSLMLLSSTGAIANASGSVLNVTSTGVNTAGNVATIIGNSATTGNILNLSGTGLTTGSVLTATAATTTGKGVNITTNGITSGTALDLNSTSTAGTGSGTSKIINIARSGANANASHTAYGVFSAITNTGTTSTNVAGYFSASGATNNNAIIVPASGGNVGIGTSTPRGVFDVTTNGNIYLANDPVTGTGQSLFLPGNVYITPYNASNYCYFDARRSDNSGTTNLRVRLYNSGSINTGCEFNGTGQVMFKGTGPTHDLQLATDDAYKTTTSTWAIPSDERLKKEITTFTDGLALVRQIKTYNYKYNGIGGTPSNNEVQVGILAQEMQAIAPYTVKPGKIMLTEEDAAAYPGTKAFSRTEPVVDASGNAKVDVEGKPMTKNLYEADMLTFNAHGLFFVLINAVKDLDAENQSLKARIQALENK